MTKYIKNTPEYEISATFDRNRQYHSNLRNIPYSDAVSYEKDDAVCEKNTDLTIHFTKTVLKYQNRFGKIHHQVSISSTHIDINLITKCAKHKLSPMMK